MAEANGKRPPRSKHRSLTERIVVTGVLELTTPAHFGNGDADEATDLPLLVDEVDGSALITGASLAGALRNYLRERQWGYESALPTRNVNHPDYEDRNKAENGLLASKLFGVPRGYTEGAQSPLIVEDAPSVNRERPETELRDSVKIQPETRTAEGKMKYDYQLLLVGTRFDLTFELLLNDEEKENESRKKALALALQGLAKGEIRLGAKKRRGFGCCRVTEWSVTTYKLCDPNGLIAWLTADRKDSKWKFASMPEPVRGSDIAALLGVTLTKQDLVDLRESFEIEADFEIDGSLLIRSVPRERARGADAIHLQTRRKGTDVFAPVLPGTSMAGALRQRALRIANTLAKNDEAARRFINDMFGPDEIKSGQEPRVSRVLVNEELITGGQDLVQTRIKIDRFTGGTMEGALLEEVPHFGGEVKLRMWLRNPSDAEVGLLLLVLKDLWLGDLPLGGESSIGRGRLHGVKATFRRSREDEITMSEEARNGAVTFTAENAADRLESYVNAFRRVDWTEVK